MSYWDFSKPFNNSLPRQQLPLAKKLKVMDKYGVSEWGKNNLDSLEAIGRYQYYFNLPLRDNYAIVSKEFDLKHYYDTNEYYDLTSAISQEFDVPYHLKHYDIIGKYVNLLLGEYLNRPDNFTIRAEDVESTNERLRVKTDLLQSYMGQKLNQEINGKLKQQGLDPERNKFSSEEEKAQYEDEVKQKYQELTPEAIQNYVTYDYRTAAESWGTGVLSNDRKKFNFREQEQVEFSDMLIVDRCFSHLYMSPLGYQMEYWNPQNVFFHQSPEVRYAEDGDYIGRVFYLSKAQVIDRFGWRMHKKQLELLYPNYLYGDEDRKGGVYGEFFHSTMMPFSSYRDYAAITGGLGYDPFNNSPVGEYPSYSDLSKAGFPIYQFATGDIVQCTEAYWKSQMLIGRVRMINPETQQPEIHIVDETFDPVLFGIEELEDTFVNNGGILNPDEQPINTIIWTWVTQVWQGCKINANINANAEVKDRNAIYFDIKPCPFQFKGDITPFQPKLPVIGGVFSNRNGKSNSVVDLLKPYQIGYNAFMNQAYGIAQRNNGKLFFLNVRLLPKWKDWGGEEALEKAMAIGRELNIIPINDSNENLGGGGIQFNQQQMIDLDESEKVERLMKLAVLWEEQGERQIGITPQRQGVIQASETATATRAASVNSYAITEPYFMNFNNYKRRKLNALLDMAQFCASKENDITLSYIQSDLGEAFVKTTGTEVFLRHLGVNITNDQDTLQDLEMAKKLAVENNTTKLPMSGLIQMISLKSVADISKKVQELEKQQQEAEQEAQKQQMQLEQQKLKATADEKQKDRDLSMAEAQLKASTDLQKATISAVGFDADVNKNPNGQIDVLGVESLQLDRQKLDFENANKLREHSLKLIDSQKKDKLEKDKLQSQKELQAKEHALSKKEMENRLMVENKKQKQIETQNASQEKMATEKHQAELLLKEKDLELKKLELQKGKKTLGHEVQGSKDELNTQKTINKIDVNAHKEVTKDDVKTKKKLNLIKIKKSNKPPKTS